MPTASAIGGTTNGRVEMNSISGRSFGSHA